MQRVRIADILAVAALTLLTNFTYLFFSNGDYFFPDSVTYLTPARNLLRGIGFATEPGLFDTLRTPGYPLFLLPFVAWTNSSLPIVIGQHLLNAALAVSIVILTLRIARSRAAALIAGSVFALDVPTIHHANKVLTETLFTAVLLILFVMILRLAGGVRLRAYATAGLLCGVLVLIRPVAIAWFVVVAVFLAWNAWVSGGQRVQKPAGEPAGPARRLQALAIALFVIAALVLPIGWMTRNYVRTGYFTLSSVAGVNMLLHRAAGSLAIMDPREFYDALADRQEQLTDEADAEIERRLHIDDVNDLSPTEIRHYYGEIGRRIALQHPVGLFFLTCHGLLVNIFDSDGPAVSMISRLPGEVVMPAIDAWTYAVDFAALVGLAWLWRIRREVAALMIAAIAYFVLISAGSEAEARFRVPVMPLVAMAAGIGAVQALGQGISRETETEIESAA